MARPRVSLRARLLAQTAPPDTNGCQLWTGYVRPDGYAEIGSGGGGGKPLIAHRVAYEFFVGPIPDGLVIDHLCRVRHCVNPAHLEVVTQRENILRGEGLAAVNATKTHCPQGHPYDEANTVLAVGRRECRVCNRAKHRRYRLRKKVPA